MIISSKSGECNICGREMKYEDNSFDHDWNGVNTTERDGCYYCDQCNSEREYDNNTISHQTSTQSPTSKEFYNTYSTEDKYEAPVIIVANEDTVLAEIDELDGYTISNLIDIILEKECK